jgi:hypothetical protein
MYLTLLLYYNNYYYYYYCCCCDCYLFSFLLLSPFSPVEWRGKIILKSVPVKGKLSLCLIKHHVMKADWEVEVLLNEFLISVLDVMIGFVFGKCSVRISAGAPAPHFLQSHIRIILD